MQLKTYSSIKIYWSKQLYGLKIAKDAITIECVNAFKMLLSQMDYFPRAFILSETNHVVIFYQHYQSPMKDL